MNRHGEITVALIAALALGALSVIAALRGGTRTIATIDIVSPTNAISIRIERRNFLATADVPLIRVDLAGATLTGYKSDGAAAALDNLK